MLYCIIGKSGAGKDTLYGALLQNMQVPFTPVIPYTTRPMREGERDGATYHFVTQEQLEAMEAQGLVVEKRVYQTVAGPWTYFTPKFSMEPGVRYLMIATPEALEKLREVIPWEELAVIYLFAPDDLRLERSIRRERQQAAPNYAEVCRRFLADEVDFRNIDRDRFAYFLDVNAALSVTECADAVVNFVQSCEGEKLF